MQWGKEKGPLWRLLRSVQGSKGFSVACRTACAAPSGLSSCSQSGGKCLTPSETGPRPCCHV